MASITIPAVVWIKNQNVPRTCQVTLEGKLKADEIKRRVLTMVGVAVQHSELFVLQLLDGKKQKTQKITTECTIVLAQERTQLDQMFDAFAKGFGGTSTPNPFDEIFKPQS